MTLVRKLLILSATLLLVAILPLPIEFYMPLRIVVCGTAAYSAYYFFDNENFVPIQVQKFPNTRIFGLCGFQNAVVHRHWLLFTRGRCKTLAVFGNN